MTAKEERPESFNVFRVEYEAGSGLPYRWIDRSTIVKKAWAAVERHFREKYAPKVSASGKTPGQVYADVKKLDWECMNDAHRVDYKKWAQDFLSSMMPKTVHHSVLTQEQADALAEEVSGLRAENERLKKELNDAKLEHTDPQAVATKAAESAVQVMPWLRLMAQRNPPESCEHQARFGLVGLMKE